MFPADAASAVTASAVTAYATTAVTASAGTASTYYAAKTMPHRRPAGAPSMTYGRSVFKSLDKFGLDVAC